VVHLRAIEATIRGERNRVKYVMNSALINIGVRKPKLERLAIAAAVRQTALDAEPCRHDRIRPAGGVKR